MKPLKLFMDARPGEIPENSYPYGKNGIQFDLSNVSFNEPGFSKMLAAIPYSLNGIIETDSKFVILSTNNTNSAIGFFNPVTELYEPIVDDNPLALVNWPNNGQLLGFNLEFYITGESQRNYKGELVIAFTDKNAFPKYVNCDVPAITRLDDIRLFPYYSPGTIDLNEDIGGSLVAGAYYIAHGYERYDGTITPFSEVTGPLIIRPDAIGGQSLDKSMLIRLSELDESYNFVRLAVISKINGKTSAVLLTDYYPISGSTLDVLYTGDNLSEEISIEELLTPPAIYEKVGTIGQLNDTLWLGNLEKEIELVEGLQKYVNRATVQWVSELIDATSPPLEHVQGKKRSFMHEEVYALYIRFHKTRGGFTKSFHLPGRFLPAIFTGNSTEAVSGGETVAVPRYKVEDCIPFFDPVAKTGLCGSWLNDTEVYPNNDEYNAVTIGGADLRGLPVMHHKMPSLRWCKNNLYASVPDYGRTKLDLLSLQVTNLELPPDYVNLIDGYELLYAKRTPSNMTVYGQAPLLHGAVQFTETGIPTGNVNIYTTGGNWTSSIVHAGSGDYDDDLELTQLRQNTMRIHPFDVLLNKPSIEPTFISAQYKLRREKLKTEGYLEDGAHNGEHNMPTVHLVDYTVGNTPASISAGRQLRKILTSNYLAIGITANRFNNVKHENTFAGTLGGTNWPLNHGDMGFRIRGASYTEIAQISDFEETYMVNLIAVKADLYSSFYSQRLISAGRYRAVDNFTPFTGGDTFVCDYTFHTYGRHDRADTEGEDFKGKKVIRRVVCESVSNIHQRFEIAGNNYSKWYPRTAVAFHNPDGCYITYFNRSIDPNQFGYSKDSNALNDFISSTIFNVFSEEITKFPYRVHRGGKLSRQTKPRSWRTFLPLDFYECQKNMGVIINVTGMYDRLIIHHENAMFITQSKARLDSGVLSIVLGTGDIFQFEPQETSPSKLGYAGTQHDLACIKVPIGYFFPDAEQGELYLWSGGDRLVNMNEGVDTFLREYLKVKEKNVYSGNGITLGYDQDYKRLLVTVKNNKAAGTTVKEFVDTDEFFDDLVVGDIVNYEGRYIEYKGINDPDASGFECTADVPPPDEFGWEADAIVCEQDTIAEESAEFTPQSSPARMQYDSIEGKMFVIDHDNAAGNFYEIDTTSGTKTYKSYIGTLYSMVADKDTRRLFGSALATGLIVYDIATDTISTVAYGTDVALSRTGLWKIGDNLVANDEDSNTLTLIDRNTLNVIATIDKTAVTQDYNLWLDRPFELLEVDGTVWVIPANGSTSGIAVYSQDFSTLLQTFTLSAEAVVTGWGGSNVYQNAYYDAEYGKVYIHDVGSSKTFVMDKDDYSELEVYEWLLLDGAVNILIGFIFDPVKNKLYLNYNGVDTDGVTSLVKKMYVIDRLNNVVTAIFSGAEIPGVLEREGLTEYMWVAIPGLKSWEGGGWATDGTIIQYIHGAAL